MCDVKLLSVKRYENIVGNVFIELFNSAFPNAVYKKIPMYRLQYA